MEEIKDKSGESKGGGVGDILFSGLGFFVLLVVLIGAFFEVRNNPEVDFDFTAILIGGGLLVFTGLMLFSDIGSMMKISWAQRLNDYIAAAGIVCIMLLMLYFGICSIFTPQEGFPVDKWRGLFIITALLWPAIGVYIFVNAWRSQEKDALFRSPIMASIWPLLIFMKSPAIFLALLLVHLVFVGGGEWIGSFFNYPVVGAWSGFGLLALLVFLAIRGKSKGD